MDRISRVLGVCIAGAIVLIAVDKMASDAVAMFLGLVVAGILSTVAGLVLLRERVGREVYIIDRGERYEEIHSEGYRICGSGHEPVETGQKRLPSSSL